MGRSSGVWRSLLSALLCGCGGIEAVGDAGDASTGSDVGSPDTGESCDGATAFDDPCSWSTFDLSAIGADGGIFWGGAFDGKYVYVAPNANGPGPDSVVFRLDTSGTFESTGSWTGFDLAGVTGAAGGFIGAAFDGRYVYFVPMYEHDVGGNGTVARYDTTSSFADVGSWSAFDLTTMNKDAQQFFGAVFDGRYIYLAPTFFSGAVRFDTTAPFDASGSWEIVDVETVTAHAASSGFAGAVFDGRYVYFVPDELGISGVVVRYDTTGAFDSSQSWSTFDLHWNVDPNAAGFWGGAFDGRYLYLVPHDGSSQGLVTRYDTTAAFTSTTSWSTFDVTTVAPGAFGFFGAGFDGRFLYLVPSANTTFDGVVARFDTTAAFTAPSSWSTFDVSQLNPNAVGFAGAAFDGQNLYLLPGSGTIARYHARPSAAMPKLPGWNGSFL